MMTLIACCDARWGIGKDNNLLLRIPDDMRHFRTVTTGKTIICGRKTLETFPGGKPLPGRRNIILSRSKLNTDAEVCGSVVEAIELTRYEPEVYIAGGGEIYDAFLPYCQKALITRLNAVFDADVFFPDLDGLGDWKKINESATHIFEGTEYIFCEYVRI